MFIRKEDLALAAQACWEHVACCHTRYWSDLNEQIVIDLIHRNCAPGTDKGLVANVVHYYRERVADELNLPPWNC